MSPPTAPGRPGATHAVRGLVGAAHPGPALAVTVLVALLVVRAAPAPATGVLVVAAVLAGQLSIGWSNDLVDAARDRAVGRRDKPLATGAVAGRHVRTACAVAVLAAVALSLACGLLAGLVHLVCVGAGWAYNLGLKSTAWSWLPYAVAFGALPVFVALRRRPRPAAAAVGAGRPGRCSGSARTCVNVLPDLADDAATGVRGLPHRLGAALRPGSLAAAVLVAGHRGASWSARPAGRPWPPGRALARRSLALAAVAADRPRAARRSAPRSASRWSTSSLLVWAR